MGHQQFLLMNGIDYTTFFLLAFRSADIDSYVDAVTIRVSQLFCYTIFIRTFLGSLRMELMQLSQFSKSLFARQMKIVFGLEIKIILIRK